MSNIIRRGPFSELMNMRNEMDRLLGDTFRLFDQKIVDDRLGLQPSMDIYETAEAIVANIDLPGISKEDIKINIVNNEVTISGEISKENREENGTYFLQERSSGKFYRSFSLNTPVDTEKVKASFKDGVLELKLPKAEQAKPKDIQIDG
ncbi:MAG: hypothetical protein APF76_16440 [Desulfitibacter sp. BRH_c19]|nr:MAG: hypothetical protein APF76_16440 [Desulfitibacter sp. BRH_c19]